MRGCLDIGYGILDMGRIKREVEGGRGQVCIGYRIWDIGYWI